jgi:hypothetical protein
MGPIEIEFKIEELRRYIEELFTQLYWNNSDDMSDIETEINVNAIEDILDFLEETECPTKNLRNLVVKNMLVKNTQLLPKIMYEVDIELEKLGMCLKNISYATTADTATDANTDADSAKYTIDARIAVNRIDLNIVDLNKIADLNKIKIN